MLVVNINEKRRTISKTKFSSERIKTTLELEFSNERLESHYKF